MTVISLNHRLRKFENWHGYRGNVRQLSDAQLDALIRASYGALEAEHGSLVRAISHLRSTGNEDDAVLAALIAEDVGEPDAAKH